MPDITYPGVYVEEVGPVGHPIDRVATSVTAFVGSAPRGPVDQAITVRSVAEFERTFGPTAGDEPLAASVACFFANGGADAMVVRASGAVVPSREDGTGLYALGTADRFNLLCLPDLGAGAGAADTSALAAALAEASRLCEERRALLIVDPLPSWRTVAEVTSGPTGVAWLAAGMRRANAAVYFPRLFPVPGASSSITELSPAGAVAGIMARTDAARGVWKAPAGQEAAIRGIGGLSATLSEDEADTLSEAGVNTLRALRGRGPVVWGARTLARANEGPPEWKYIPVRRTALFIEESLDRGLLWVVFEPNDEPLWLKIRTSVANFLAGLFHGGALQGATPRQAYFVKCDRETTTEADVAAGIVRVLVGFAMLRPAEFTLLEIRHQAAPGGP